MTTPNNLAASGDSDEVPEYDVDLSKNLNSFQLAIWGDTYEIPESYADFTALGWVYSGDDARKSSRNPSQRAKSLKRTETRLPSILPIRTPRQSQWRNALIGGIHIDTSTAEGPEYLCRPCRTASPCSSR